LSIQGPVNMSLCIDFKYCNNFFNNFWATILQGTDERRCQLKDSKHFECHCSRCDDSTELGTEMSSLKCPRCHKGLIRPKTWQCSLCKRIYHNSLIKMTLMECRRRIDEIGKHQHSRFFTTFNTKIVETLDIETLERLLRKLSFTFHPHHYLVLEIEQNLVRLYAQSAATVKNLRRKIELCEKLLEIFRKIEPGISRIQAIAMYELHSAVANLAQKSFRDKEISKEEFVKKLLFAENTLKSSIKYLLYEPINSPEGRLAQNALSELKVLRLTIGNLQKDENTTQKKCNKGKKKKT
jgi:hypothetical protein